MDAQPSERQEKPVSIRNGDGSGRRAGRGSQKKAQKRQAMKDKASKPKKAKASGAEQFDTPLAVKPVQWLKLAEREKLYVKSVPDFQKMLLTDHRGMRLAERVNVAGIVSKASGVSESTVRRDIRTLRLRALKGKAPAEVELYPYLLHVKKMNALAEQFTERKIVFEMSDADIEVEAEIVSELRVSLEALIKKLSYFSRDPAPLENLHDVLMDALTQCRREIKDLTDSVGEFENRNKE